MSGIAGFVARDTASQPEHVVCRMLADQWTNSDKRRRLHSAAGVSFGKNCVARTYEDRHEVPDASLEDFDRLMIFDGRIDNRADIAHILGMHATVISRMSDESLCYLLCREKGVSWLSKVVGDFCFARFCVNSKTLQLYRSPYSTNTLFYTHLPAYSAFSSLPQSIAEHCFRSKSLNIDHVLRNVLDIANPIRSSYFADVSQCEPGKLLSLSPAGMRAETLWSVEGSLRCQKFAGVQDFSEALFSSLQNACLAMTRRHSGSLAAHLSAGRDSSAVVGTIAQAIADLDVLNAITAAPPLGYDAPSIDGRYGDESVRASKTARMYSNVKHHIVREFEGNVSEKIRDYHKQSPNALLGVSNLPWFHSINDLAKSIDATVLFTGALGNYTISFQDTFLKNPRQNLLSSIASNVAATIDGRLTPRAFTYRVLRPLLSDRAATYIQMLRSRSFNKKRLELVAAEYRVRAQELIEQDYFNQESNAINRMASSLASVDCADTLTFGRWGIDVRDPTADRRVIEVCLSAPDGAFFRQPSGSSKAYELAFASVIPPHVMTDKRRGYQSADWLEHFGSDQIQILLKRAMAGAASSLLDFDALRNHLSDQRLGNQATLEDICFSRNIALGVLAVGDFVEAHF